MKKNFQLRAQRDMSTHKSAVLLAILSLAWVSSSAPIVIDGIEEESELTPLLADSKSLSDLQSHDLRPEEADVPGREYELELRAAEQSYRETQDPLAKEYIDWIKLERSKLTISRLYRPGTSLTRIWREMDHYAQYEYWRLKESNPKPSLRSRLTSLMTSSLPPVSAEVEKTFALFRQHLDNHKFGSEQTLTKMFLNMRTSNQLKTKGLEAFENAIATAVKYDAKRRVLDDVALKDIARSLVRIDHMHPPDPSIADHLLVKNHPGLRKALGRRQFKILKREYDTMNRLREGVDIFQTSQAVPFLDFEKHSACGYMRLARRRRRRGALDCLLSEEEYRKVVKKVGKLGGVKEVVDTEKFLGLLYRVTAEDPAAKRDQLLKLGAALSEDPGVLLEGDYVTEFRDAVKVLDQAVPSHVLDIPRSQLPENRFGEAGQALESHKLPLNHPSPGEISSYPADRISAHPHGIFHEPIEIHDPIIHPEKFGGVNSRVPMPEFRGQIKPLFVPEITRPIEITPVKTFPMPEVRLAMSKSRLPMIGRG